MTIISDTAKEVINKNREFKKLAKKMKAHKKDDESWEEYFLGTDPRKTKYYKEMMKKK